VKTIDFLVVERFTEENNNCYYNKKNTESFCVRLTPTSPIPPRLSVEGTRRLQQCLLKDPHMCREMESLCIYKEITMLRLFLVTLFLMLLIVFKPRNLIIICIMVEE
jgi:hypothetical protein